MSRRLYRNSGTYRSGMRYRGSDVIGYVVDLPRRRNTAMRAQVKAPKSKTATTAPASKA